LNVNGGNGNRHRERGKYSDDTRDRHRLPQRAEALAVAATTATLDSWQSAPATAQTASPPDQLHQALFIKLLPQVRRVIFNATRHYFGYVAGPAEKVQRAATTVPRSIRADDRPVT
jgi:hypothetical protein